MLTCQSRTRLHLYNNKQTSASERALCVIDMSVNKLKNFFNVKNIAAGATVGKESEPQIGFRVSYCEANKQLKVKVIGARHLPVVYGTTRPQGYLVKVRVFPGKEKYETGIVKESWPHFNQEFDFDLRDRVSAKKCLTGKFVSFTVYAILENLNEKQNASMTLKRGFQMFTGKKNELSRNSKSRISRRVSINNRRTIGAATYNLDAKSFTQRLKNDYVCTLDIWRKLEQISSGIEHETREPKKGCLEVTMNYSISEDGENDTIEVRLSKLRCSMQTMQQHEKLGGHLYIKVAAYEYDVRIAKLKSDRFEPTISLKIEPKSATLLARVNRHNLDKVKVVITLIGKNLLAAKQTLGQIVIDDSCDIWKEVMEMPSNSVTRMIDLE